MKAKLGALLGPLVAAALLAGASYDCSASPRPATTADSGADHKADVARPPDASPDAGEPPPFDAGFNPFVGDWTAIPNAPKECGAKIAKSPGTDVSPMTWAPCSSGRPGCKRLIVDWTSEPGTTILFLRDPVRLVGGKAWLAFSRWYPPKGNPNGLAAVMSILAPIDEPPVFAIGDFIEEPYACVGMPGVDPSGISVLVSINVQPTTVGLLRSSFATPQDVTWTGVPTSAFGMFGGGGVQTFSRGDNRIYLSTSNPYTTVLYDFAAKTPRLPAFRIPAELPVGVLNGAFAEGDIEPQGIFFLHDDATYAKVYAGALASQVFALDADASNQDAPVWLEGDVQGPEPTNILLRTAPYGTTWLLPQTVAKIAKLKPLGGIKLVANAGMALVLNDTGNAQLIRLSDGLGWSIPAETEDAFSQPLWVDDNEVWISTAPAQWWNYPSGIVRIGRAGLGAPTLPSGL